MQSVGWVSALGNTLKVPLAFGFYTVPVVIHASLAVVSAEPGAQRSDGCGKVLQSAAASERIAFCWLKGVLGVSAWLCTFGAS